MSPAIIPNMANAVPASIRTRGAGLIRPMASAIGAADCANAKIRVPCTMRTMAMYKIVTDAVAMASASGIVRVGRVTSPLLNRDVSIPVSAKAARMRARPIASGCHPGCGEKFAPRTAAAPTTTRMTSGKRLSAAAAVTSLAPRAAAADVNEGDATDGTYDDSRTYRHRVRTRRHARRHVSKGDSNPGAGEQITEPEERTRDVTGKRTQGCLDIPVHSAARGHTASALGTANANRPDPQGAGEECQGCVGTDGGGECAGCCENAGTDRHAHKAGREPQRSQRPNQAGVALELHDPPRELSLTDRSRDR